MNLGNDLVVSVGTVLHIFDKIKKVKRKKIRINASKGL